MTIFRYRHVSEWPRVYDGLRHGIEAIVHRHQDDPEAEPPAPPAEGSTVLLQPGDEIETPQVLDHPHLQPVNAAAKKAATDPGAAIEAAGAGAAAVLQVLKTAAEGAAPNPDAADSGDPEPTGESK